MPSFSRLLSTLSVAAVVAASTIVTPVSRGAIVPPGLQGAWVPDGKLVVKDTPKTDFGGIAASANTVDQPASSSDARLRISDASSSVAKLSTATPTAYELVFGPTSGANNAPGYMGFTLLAAYDPSACAAACNARAADSTGGSCQFFNIWRATFLGIPLANVCTLYYLPTDASTATTTNTNGLQVAQSRGYKRKNFAVDGGFEGYADCTTFCFTESYANWVGTSPAGGSQDATVFYFPPYARTGHSVALLGSANNEDALPGTLTAASPILTTAGKKYKIGFFHASSFSGPDLAGPAFVNVQWNGKTVKTIRPGYSNYTYFEVQVTGTGRDKLAFNGGIAPAWSFIDDISVYQL